MMKSRKSDEPVINVVVWVAIGVVFSLLACIYGAWFWFLWINSKAVTR